MGAQASLSVTAARVPEAIYISHSQSLAPSESDTVHSPSCPHVRLREAIPLHAPFKVYRHVTGPTLTTVTTAVNRPPRHPLELHTNAFVKPQ